MLTIRNTDVETITRDAVNVGGHQIAVSWDSGGARINRDDLARLRRDGFANWSDEEIEDIAFHAEARMDQTYSKAYEIGVYEGYNLDQWHALASIRAADDAAASAYAEEHYGDYEWYILDANGENING